MEEDQGTLNGGFDKEAQDGEKEDSNRENGENGAKSPMSASSEHEKQDTEQKEVGKEIDVGLRDTSLARSDLAEPLLSDEDDHDRLETQKKLRETYMAEVVSDTEISEIPIQDNASDREILDDEEVEEDKDTSVDNVGSVSDDSEPTISEDRYLSFPTSTKQDGSNTTDTILQGLAETGTTVSDIFVEPRRRSPDSSPIRMSTPNFDNSRSKYSRPRMPQPVYSPFTRPAPIGYYLDDEEIHVSSFQ